MSIDADVMRKSQFRTLQKRLEVRGVASVVRVEDEESLPDEFAYIKIDPFLMIRVHSSYRCP